MKILVACEFSGIVRDAFRAKGHDAISCDLEPSERPGPHIQGDVRRLLHKRYGWDMMLAFPPCTYLARSGLHWMHKQPDRIAKAVEALDFVATLLAAPIPKIVIENPYGLISKNICPFDQTINPHWYGHRESKATCLWLKGVPKLHPGKNRVFLLPGETWDNVLPGTSGQHRRSHSKNRAKDASRAYPGIAAAMADAWG